jgi:flavin reductase (DIM6/NTAB) family NADH-FMN oxidoreductase RutF
LQRAISAGRDELKAAGLTAMLVKIVALPWIKEAPAAFECRRYVTLEVGKSRETILGEILFAHYHSDVVDADRLHIDPAKLDAIARLGGNTRFHYPRSLRNVDSRLGRTIAAGYHRPV